VVSWASRFADPIVLPNGQKLASLREAIAHLVNTVPARERQMPSVVTAAELLTGAAEDGVPIDRHLIGARTAKVRFVPNSEFRRSKVMEPGRNLTALHSDE
jgi:hypothetical protein